MHVLSVNKFFWRKGGSEAVFFSEKELLEKHGHAVVPFSMKHPNNEASSYEKYFIENVDYSFPAMFQRLSAAAKIIYSFESRRKISELLQTEHVDLAHFHIFQHQISPSVFGPLKKKRIPIVLTLHDLKPLCPNYKMFTHDGICERCKGNKFYNCLLHRCSKGATLGSLINSIEMYFHYAAGYYQGVDKYIAASNYYRKKMIEFGFPSNQVVYIANAIDTSRFEFSGFDGGYGLYFGRLSAEKGVATLMRALKANPDIPFFIVGSGPEEQSMMQLATKLGLKNIKFTGFKSNNELKKIIMGSSFTVIPSEWYENCPMAVLESFAFGKPVIGARIGGIPELIRDEIDGLTFEPGNIDDLSGQMRLLWDDPEKRKLMGKNGREKVEREYNPEKHYKQLMRVYKEVLDR